MKTGSHFLTLEQICEITGQSYDTVWRRAKAGYYKGTTGGRGRPYLISRQRFEKQFDVSLTNEPEPTNQTK